MRAARDSQSASAGASHGEMRTGAVGAAVTGSRPTGGAAVRDR